MNHSNKKPHIALYIGSLSRGGAERVMVNLAEYLHEAGWQVTFVTTYVYPEEYPVAHAAWTVTGVPGPNGEHGALNPVAEQDLRGIRRVLSGLTDEEMGRNRLLNIVRRRNKLTRIFRELRPDVILSFLGKNNVMAISCGRAAGIPVIVSVRSNPAREYADARLRREMLRLFPKAAAVVLQTNEAVQYFPEKIQEKAVVLPNSVNPMFLEQNTRSDQISQSEQNTDLKREPDAAHAVRHTIITVGRLDQNKNQQLLLRAFAKVYPQHPDWQLVLYGDGPSMEEDKALAETLGIEQATVFTGSVNDVRDRIAQDGIFVLTSRQEGMPNALLEAMALGLPCISTDCKGGGPRDVIRDGENGILIPIDDEAALTQALRELIEQPDKAARLGAAAAQDMEAYAPELVNQRWEECLLRAAGVNYER